MIPGYVNCAYVCQHSWADATPECDGEIVTASYNANNDLKCTKCGWSSPGSKVEQKGPCGRKLCDGKYRRCSSCCKLQYAACAKKRYSAVLL